MNNKNVWIKHVVTFMFLGAVYIFNFKNIYTLAIFNDEFGYWGNAAILAGKDWKDLLSITPNYSMGYSIILFPFVRLINESTLLYKLAILINMFFLVVSYFCAFYIYSNLFGNIKNAYGVSAASVLSGFALIQSQIAWAETLLSMIYWVTIALFISIIKKFSVYKEVLLYMSVFYLYLIHQRTLFSCCFILIIFSVFLIRERKFKNLVITGIVFAVGIILYKYIQNYQRNIIYQASDFSDFNTLKLSGTVALNYIEILFSRFKDIAVSFLAKLYASSLMLMGLGFLFLVGCLKRIKDKDKYSYVFILVSFDFLLMLCLSSIRMISADDRADFTVYTRYLEYTIGPCLLTGMGAFFNHEVKRKYIIYNLLFCWTMTKIVFPIMGQTNAHFNVCCSPHVGAFVEGAKDLNVSDNIYYQAMLYVLISLFFLLCIFGAYRKRSIYIFVVFACINIFVYHYGNMQTNTYREIQSGIVGSAADILLKEDIKEIYYLFDEEYLDNSRYVKSLQSRLPNIKIHLVRDLNEISGYVISNYQLDNCGDEIYESKDTFYMYSLN